MTQERTYLCVCARAYMCDSWCVRARLCVRACACVRVRACRVVRLCAVVHLANRVLANEEDEGLRLNVSV